MKFTELAKYRQFRPDDCSFDPVLNWEIHQRTDNPFFNNIITRYEDLNDEYINLFFIHIPPWNFITKSIEIY